jgi:hypothetical protein
MNELHALSSELSCEPHLLSTHDTHEELAPAWLARQFVAELLPLLLEQANAAIAAPTTAPAIMNAFIIVADLPGRRAPSP